MPEAGWTNDQAAAIAARGGPLLVSAAAGSGKTAVLVERAVGMITDPVNPTDADRLLIVTFTNAAAAEMKSRIGARLAELARRAPGAPRPAGQQVMLARAHIGTIHAFCLDLVRQNFQHLPVAHDFTLAGEGELEILRQECAASVLEEFYARDGGHFRELVELLSSGKDDSRLVEALLRLYDFARAKPFYRDWLDEVEALYRKCPALEETAWGRVLRECAAETLEACVRLAEETLALARSEPAAEAAYGAALAADAAQLRRCRDILAAGEWDAAVAAAGETVFAKLNPLRGCEALKARVQGARARCKKMKEKLSSEILCATRADFAGDMAHLAPMVATLFDLCRAFDTAFAALKAGKKRLDFADLEHFALDLLARPENGGFALTERARRLAESFDYILVDEYQDVSEVQETLFVCVSRMQRNLFMVGDAKQGIYSFRLARPDVFLEKKRGYAAYTGDSGSFPAKITLDLNFRSRPQVTGAVNFLFSLLMSRRLGDIDYTGNELLRRGALYPEEEELAALNSPELLLLCNGGDEEADNTVLEARMVARRVAALLESGHPVTVGGAIRRCRPGDICILMRSPRRRQQVYCKALEEAGLPVSALGDDGFLAQREVSMVLSLLEALDNPLHDLPLVAALLSPLFPFDEDDIAAIRLEARREPFYRAMEAAASRPVPETDAKSLPLPQKCRDFLALFQQLRARAALLPADRLLLEIYAHTGALAVAQAMPPAAAAPARRANLLLLAEYAAQYHKLGYKQLGGLVAFLSRLRERGGDLAPAAAAAGDAVRILSIHRAKGLEFPIVILADTARRFNKKDLSGDWQLHHSLGFACARRDRDTLARFTTLPMQAIRLKSRGDLLGEELRILYVALTRAREKLIITGCIGERPDKRIESARGDMICGKLHARSLEEARAPVDWLLAALLRHPDAQALREAGGCGDIVPVADGTRWRVTVETPSAGKETPLAAHEPQRTCAPDENFLALLRARCGWQYPHGAHTRIPAKLAVSALARGEAAAGLFAARPAFLRAGGMTGAQRGEALHRFLQFADYHRARADLAAEIDRMRSRRFLSPAEAAALDTGRLARFFHSGLAARIFASPRVWRELRFLGEYGPEVLGEHLEGMDQETKVALQGVADCVFEEAGGAVIVDYKTDAVGSADELVGRYGTQLRLYRHILGDALPLPVTECILYSFALERAVAVE